MTDAGSNPVTKTKGRRRRARRRRKAEELVFYELRVTDWDYYYGFYVSDPKSRFDPGPYSETATLTFKGPIVNPEGSRYKEGALTFSARRGLMHERYEEAPNGVGSLSAHDETLSAYVFVPMDRFAELATIAGAGRIQVAKIIGTKLRYRSGLVRNVSLNTEIDEDEEE